MNKVRANKATATSYDNVAIVHHGPTKQTLAAFKQHHLERNSYNDEGSLQLFEKPSLKSTTKLFFIRRVLFIILISLKFFNCQLLSKLFNPRIGL